MTEKPEFNPRPLALAVFTATTLMAFAPVTLADVLAGWDVSTLIPSGSNDFGPSPLSAAKADANVTVGGFARGVGVGTTGTGAQRAWGGNTWNSASSASAITANQFATFSVTPKTGYQMSLSSISKFDYRRSSSGATTGVLQYQIGSGAFTDISTVSYASNSSSGASLPAIDLSGIAALQNLSAGTQVTFRIVNFGGTSSAGTWYIFDTTASSAADFEVSGITSPISSTPSVNLSVSTNAGSEDGTTQVTVTATASSAVSSDQTVELGVTGTGITAADYSLSGSTISIQAGQTTGSVTFTINDDVDIEGVETAILALSNPSSGIILGTSASQAISIADNDTPPTPPNLSINDVTQVEGNSGTSNFVFTVSLDAAAPTGGVSFNMATADASATAGSDYVAQSINQTIPAGSTSATFTVVVNGDSTFESNETFNVNVSNVSGATVTDGQAVGSITNDDAASACGTPATKISAIQGNGSSVSSTSATSIEGIVVGDYQGDSSNSLRGFFIQEEDADTDGNAATSEGIFVFDGTNPTVNVSVGDRVRVSGTPAEFFNMSQLGTVTKVEVCASNQAMPTPASLTLPVPGVPSGDLAAATTAINNYYEAFEGMLVKFPSTLRVSEYFQLERYGQLVLTESARIQSYTNQFSPSVKGYINHQIKLAKRRIILDDTNNIQNYYVGNYATTNKIPLPFPTGGLSTTNRFRGNDSITNLTGVLHWSFAGQSGTDAWRIRPVEEKYDYVFSPGNYRKGKAPSVGGSLKIAAFNVLNYFTTIDATSSTTSGTCGPDGTQDCRGADSADELVRQTAKAARALCAINADIFGLIEIENNATASLDGLITATSAIKGCGPFSKINTGAIGTDAIKVGFLYKAATVSPVGNFELLTSADDARFIDTKNRPSLAQTFQENASGGKLTVVTNHLKSKGSVCSDINANDTDKNDGQGNCNLTRLAAAEALVDWLATDPTGSGDSDFLLIGDMNSYAKEDPIMTVEKGSDGNLNTADDYNNLEHKFGGNSAYSYVFDGQTGSLDHALASKTLTSQVVGTDIWHINADEPTSFDYNDTIRDVGESSFEAKPAALNLYEANQYRSSDHDPVIIGVQLTESITK